MHTLPALDIDALPRDVDALRSVIVDLHGQYSRILASVHEQLLKLRRLHFGASSEQLAAQLTCSLDREPAAAAARARAHQLRAQEVQGTPAPAARPAAQSRRIRGPEVVLLSR